VIQQFTTFSVHFSGINFDFKRTLLSEAFVMQEVLQATMT